MGRHSAPTLLSRSARRATVATSALAAGAALVAAPGVAQAGLPGADAAAAGYADALNNAVLGTVQAINTTAPLYGKAITAWNGIPVAGSLVHFTQHASLSDVSSYDQLTVTAPLFGTLYNQPIAYTDGGQWPAPWGNYDRVLEYAGLFGDARTVSGWNWGSEWGTGENSVGAGAYAWLDHYTDPLGLTRTGAQIWSGELDLGNGGFAVYGPGAWLDGTVKNLGAGDVGTDGLFGLSVDNDGVWLSGPNLYAGPLGHGLGLDAGVSTGTVGFDRTGLHVTGPALTNETWDGPASIVTPAGDLVGGFNTGGGTVGPETKVDAPSGTVGVQNVLGGKGATVTGSGGTWSASPAGAGVDDLGVSGVATVPGSDHPATPGVSVDAGVGGGTPNGVVTSVTTPSGDVHDVSLGGNGTN